MLTRLSQAYVRQLVNFDVAGIQAADRDEMAIPSYLHRNPLIRWLMWRRYEQAFQLSALTDDSAVLEFGCGIGLLLPSLCKSAKSVYAIDLFPQFAKQLVEELQLDVSFVDDVSEIASGSLDVVIAADVLEHVDDVGRYALCFRNKLKKEGRLVVCGPTESVIYKLGRLFAGFGKKGEYHHRNIDDIRKCIEESGFRLVGKRALPFRVPPFLFVVYQFQAV